MKKLLTLLSVVILVVLTGCSNMPDGSEIVIEPPIHEETTTETTVTEYAGYTHITMPSISELVTGEYYIEYYNRLTHADIILCRITCTMEKINTVGNTYRYKPRYQLVSVEPDVMDVEFFGNVVEGMNTEMISLTLSAMREPTFAIYNFYVKESN